MSNEKPLRKLRYIKNVFITVMSAFILQLLLWVCAANYISFISLLNVNKVVLLLNENCEANALLLIL